MPKRKIPRACVEQEIQEKQEDAKARVDMMKKMLSTEKSRLDLLKRNLEFEKQQFVDTLKEMYAHTGPCEECDPCLQAPVHTEQTGEYTVVVKKESMEEYNRQKEDTRLMKMKWSDEHKHPESGKNDVLLFQLEKQINDEFMLKMQMQSKGKPRRVCPCKAERDGVVMPFPPKPHSHTTVYRTTLTIADIHNNNDFKTVCKMMRSDKLRSMFEAPEFCGTNELTIQE